MHGHDITMPNNTLGQRGGLTMSIPRHILDTTGKSLMMSEIL
jgi:hypothetical protein